MQASRDRRDPKIFGADAGRPDRPRSRNLQESRYVCGRSGYTRAAEFVTGNRASAMRHADFRDPFMIDHTSYGRVAPELGWVPAPRYLLRRHRALNLLKGLPRGRVLEVGCGAGALLNDLAGLGYDCTALESSSEARRVA